MLNNLSARHEAQFPLLRPLLVGNQAKVAWLPARSQQGVFQSKSVSRKKFPEFNFPVGVKVSANLYGSFSKSSFSAPLHKKLTGEHKHARLGTLPGALKSLCGQPPRHLEGYRARAGLKVIGAGRRKPCYRKATDYGALHWQEKKYKILQIYTIGEVQQFGRLENFYSSQQFLKIKSGSRGSRGLPIVRERHRATTW